VTSSFPGLPRRPVRRTEAACGDLRRSSALLRHPCADPVRIPDAERASCPVVQAGPHSPGGRFTWQVGPFFVAFRSGTRRIQPGCHGRGLALSASGFATFGIAGTAIGTADAASSPYLSQLTGDDGGADGPAFLTSTAQPPPKEGSRRTTLRPRSGQSPSPRRRTSAQAWSRPWTLTASSAWAEAPRRIGFCTSEQELSR
jgi:hypothetical protein